jgi:hypothetical protein
MRRSRLPPHLSIAARPSAVCLGFRLCEPHGAALRTMRLLVAVFVFLACALPIRADEFEDVVGRASLPEKNQPFPFHVAEGMTTPSKYAFDHAFHSSKACGPIAVYFILRLSGRTAMYSDVLARFPQTESYDMATMVKVAREFGLELQARKSVSPEDLHGMTQPAIVHLLRRNERDPVNVSSAANHFIVIGNASRKDGFSAFDPAILSYTLFDDSYLARNMSGYCLVASSASLVTDDDRRISQAEQCLWWSVGLLAFANCTLLGLQVRRRSMGRL